MRNWKMYALLFIPLLSLLKMERNSFFRYLPTITFSSLLISIISEISKSRKWWVVRKPLFPSIATDITFVLGLFFALNFWIFSFTYTKKWLYMIINIVADYLFAYPLSALAEKFNIYQLVNLKRFHLFVLSLLVACLNYLYQSYVVEPFRKEK